MLPCCGANRVEVSRTETPCDCGKNPTCQQCGGTGVEKVHIREQCSICGRNHYTVEVNAVIVGVTGNG